MLRFRMCFEFGALKTIPIDKHARLGKITFEAEEFEELSKSPYSTPILSDIGKSALQDNTEKSIKLSRSCVYKFVKDR